MVPADYVLRPVHLFAVFDVADHVLIGVVGGIDSSFCGFDRQGESVHYIERVALDLALQHTHDLNVAAGLRVHDHLDESSGRYLHLPEVVLILLPGLLLEQSVSLVLIKEIQLVFLDDYVLHLESLDGHLGILREHSLGCSLLLG